MALGVALGIATAVAVGNSSDCSCGRGTPARPVLPMRWMWSSGPLPISLGFKVQDLRFTLDLKLESFGVSAAGLGVKQT